MAGRVLKRIARENVYVSLTLPASLPFNREFAPRSATQSVEKSEAPTTRDNFVGNSCDCFVGQQT